MWYDNPGKKTSQATWSDHLQQIAIFSTVRCTQTRATIPTHPSLLFGQVEDFWGYDDDAATATIIFSLHLSLSVTAASELAAGNTTCWLAVVCVL